MHTCGLVHSSTLEKLVLSNLEQITAQGWLSILSSLQNSNLPLKQIFLSDKNTINDEVVSSFGEVLIAKKNTIERFNFCSPTGMTVAGSTALAVAFLTPMPNLRELTIKSSNFDDGALVTFASGLSNKPSLRRVDLSNANITVRGWEAISKVLCDASSLEAIQKSNHKLHQFHAASCPSNIKELLKINRSGSVSEVIRLKMIHYSDRLTIESLINDEPKKQVKLVPSVISWLGKGGDKHTALYNFIRNQTYLLGGASTNALSACNEEKSRRTSLGITRMGAC